MRHLDICIAAARIDASARGLKPVPGLAQWAAHELTTWSKNGIRHVDAHCQDFIHAPGPATMATTVGQAASRACRMCTGKERVPDPEPALADACTALHSHTRFLDPDDVQTHPSKPVEALSALRRVAGYSRGTDPTVDAWMDDTIDTVGTHAAATWPAAGTIDRQAHAAWYLIDRLTDDADLQRRRIAFTETLDRITLEHGDATDNFLTLRSSLTWAATYHADHPRTRVEQLTTDPELTERLGLTDPAQLAYASDMLAAHVGAVTQLHAQRPELFEPCWIVCAPNPTNDLLEHSHGNVGLLTDHCPDPRTLGDIVLLLASDAEVRASPANTEISGLLTLAHVDELHTTDVAALLATVNAGAHRLPRLPAQIRQQLLAIDQALHA